MLAIYFFLCPLILFEVIAENRTIAEPRITKGQIRLVNAISNDDPSSIEGAIAEGANENERHGHRQQTPLHKAVIEGKVRSLKALIRSGATVDVKDAAGLPPAAAAAQHGNLVALRLLRNRGVNLQERYREGWTLLHLAARGGHADLAHWLLDSGGPGVESRRGNGWTALHSAAFHGRLSVVRLLVDRGADLNSRDNKGLTPLHFARVGKQNNTMHFLISRGAVDPSDEVVSS